MEQTIDTGHTGHQDFSIKDWIEHLHTHEKDDPVLGHEDKLGGRVSCDQIVDEWQKWFFRIPSIIHPAIVPINSSYGSKNLRGAITNPVNVDGFKIIMVAFPPFKKLEENIINIPIYEKDTYILIPVLTTAVSTEQFPSKQTEESLVEMAKQDLPDIKNLELKIDGIERIGCHVERKTRMKIDQVPADNFMGILPERMKPNQTIEIVHDGFFALIDASRLRTGDHLITTSAEGNTYFIAATIIIRAMF